MHRTLYVLVYPSRLFAAHWSFWIPHLDAHGQEVHTGARVHVTGDCLNGFQYEYVRDYNICEDERKPISFAVGVLEAASLREETVDDHAFNAFDRACREVQAPGPSLNKIVTTGPPSKKIEVNDCQWWIKQAIKHLVGTDMILPLDEAHGARTPCSHSPLTVLIEPIRGKNLLSYSPLPQLRTIASAVPSNSEYMKVRVAELPSAENMVFRNSSFFQRNAGNLPSPKVIRQKDIKINGTRARTPRPPPIPFEELKLVVKYGSEITVAEAQCLWYFNRHMKDKVPTPELFGWCRDGGETFIYMQLVEGDTLEEAWPLLSEGEKERNLRPAAPFCRILARAFARSRSHTTSGVGDIIFSDARDANPGPYADLKAFHDFFARYSCRRHPEWNPRRDFLELGGLRDDRPTVFSHADLNRNNIIVSPRDGDSAPRVAAILDWHQSGWYPIDWEWLKVQWMCEPLDEGGRDIAWLSQILASPDEGYAYAWEYITSSL